MPSNQPEPYALGAVWTGRCWEQLSLLAPLADVYVIDRKVDIWFSPPQRGGRWRLSLHTHSRCHTMLKYISCVGAIISEYIIVSHGERVVRSHPTCQLTWLILFTGSGAASGGLGPHIYYIQFRLITILTSFAIYLLPLQDVICLRLIWSLLIVTHIQ